MGLEAECTVALGSVKAPCRVLLESEALLLRRGIHLAIPFSSIESANARDGELHLRFSGKKACLFLGKAAQKWAERIRTPKGLMDKLGVKPGTTVCLVGPVEPALIAEFEGRASKVAKRLAKGAEFVFFRAGQKADLAKLAGIRAHLADRGMIWVSWRKGKPELRENDVRKAALARGLVDVKVASISPLLSGLKLVIPLALRGEGGSRKR